MITCSWARAFRARERQLRLGYMFVVFLLYYLLVTEARRNSRRRRECARKRRQRERARRLVRFALHVCVAPDPQQSSRFVRRPPSSHDSHSTTWVLELYLSHDNTPRPTISKWIHLDPDRNHLSRWIRPMRIRKKV